MFPDSLSGLQSANPDDDDLLCPKQPGTPKKNNVADKSDSGKGSSGTPSFFVFTIIMLRHLFLVPLLLQVHFCLNPASQSIRITAMYMADPLVLVCGLCSPGSADDLRSKLARALQELDRTKQELRVSREHAAAVEKEIEEKDILLQVRL